MRPLLGFVLLHGLFLITGWSILRLLRFAPVRPSRFEAVAGVGPAMLLGVCSLVPIQAVLLVCGVPLVLVVTLLLTFAFAAAAAVVSRRRAARDATEGSVVLATWRATGRARGTLTALAVAYLAFGAWALAGLPTVGDDARIWSLKGLTLTYHHTLVADIFQNQGQAGAHPVYPLFQPGLEALLFQAMGSAQLRFFHAELWLLFAAAVWTGAYLIAQRPRTITRRPLWLIGLALLVLTPAVIRNLAMGLADVTGGALLAVGTVSLGLYLTAQDWRLLALAVIPLAAAANTKDEELLATLVTLGAAAAIDLVRNQRGAADGPRRWVLPWASAAACLAALIVPWRLWTRAHHLTDSVQPPLPHALSPAFILHRTHQLNQTTAAMLHQILSEFGWLFAIFILACAAGLRTRGARVTARFYLASIALSIIALVWLYTTTSVPLSFLIPTSMNRTVDVFMIPCAMATAHLIAQLGETRSDNEPPHRTAAVVSHAQREERLDSRTGPIPH